jgi:hypothetical protein
MVRKEWMCEMSNILSIVVAAWVGLAWLTHAVVCMNTSKWFLLLASAIFFPIGCVHGTGLWFGVFE